MLVTKSFCDSQIDRTVRDPPKEEKVNDIVTCQGNDSLRGDTL